MAEPARRTSGTLGPAGSTNSNEAPERYVDREHTWQKCLFICSGLSMCITVDILQYSMPLAFLPSVLEDRGHSPMKIATAIGIYYWTGFLGGFIITSYQCYRCLYEKQKAGTSEVTPYNEVCRHIKYLIVGLGIGTATLFLQALSPTWAMHTGCRFVQGFCGAFIFFYTFLLSVALFRGQQQVVAMTFASCALNVAEVFGSFLGAVLFDVWGQRSVFWFLGIVSMLNQVLLVKILYMVNSQEEPMVSARAPLSRQNTPLMSGLGPLGGPDAGGGPSQVCEQRTCGCLPPQQKGAWGKFRLVLESRPLVCACLLISMAACVKGSVEEMLPFHADHRWGMDPMQIGWMFCTIAIAYILSALFVGTFWYRLGDYQVIFSAYWLFMLGIVAWVVFAVVTYYPSGSALTASLAAYGCCLGMTHTPAALLLAGVIDAEEGTAKDAVNGIWNTMWEAGGSLGFLLGGLLAERYHEQMALLTSYAMFSVATALLMITIVSWPEDGCCGIADKEKEIADDYGTLPASKPLEEVP